MKRGAEDSGPPGRLPKRGDEALALRDALASLYSGRDPSFLWDPSRVWELLRPTRNVESNLTAQYKYVGREGAKGLYDAMTSMRDRQHMQVLGAKGTGKSTVVCTITGYLIGYQSMSVVYFYALPYMEDPVLVLKEALIVATGDASLSSKTSMDELKSWCREKERGALLFVVDDWDQFDANNVSAADVLSVAFTHKLLKLSSVNSRERQIWSESDKADERIHTEFFDGPYTSSEMETWVAQSGLTVEQLQHVDRLTGGIPRLLEFYEESKGNERIFEGKIRGTYTFKLFKRFIGLLKTQKHLRGALELVTWGELSPELGPGLVDFTCFYNEEDDENGPGLFRPLSPYLRSQAELYIMDQHENLQSSLLLTDIQSWVQAVTVDCQDADEEEVKSRNPARIGWNMEALVIAVVRYQKSVFGYAFKHFRTYAHGTEAAALNKLGAKELAQGVLLGPLAFNEQALDLIYIILVDGELRLVAMQITVAQWKAKSKKESHKVWRDVVLPKWKAATRKRWKAVKEEFVYIMPQSVKLDDVPQSDVRFRRLGAVHACLAVFDDLLDLAEPATVVKGELMRCSGTKVDGGRCSNKARVPEEAYYCPHHTGQKNQA